MSLPTIAALVALELTILIVAWMRAHRRAS
jgi:hypothetical protein